MENTREEREEIAEKGKEIIDPPRTSESKRYQRAQA